MKAWRDFGVGDVFIDPKEDEEKVYRIKHFSIFKGGYLEGKLLVTFEEVDGCAWTMTARVFWQHGYEQREKNAWL